ncbi:MAG: PilZ domain-containing protein [Desulfobacterales bacterium]|nr:PilZ domain-containing protein [Desulfobacterales bacterium]
MTPFEKITGSAIPKLFDALILHKTLLKLTLVDTGYENLTRIVRLSQGHKRPHFAIDIPEGFEKAAVQMDVWQIHFEFSGLDQIKYAFTTMGGEIADRHIYLELPQELDRIQRRELFRIDAPAGTRMCFKAAARQFELEVLNISIGGSLAAWVQTEAHGTENFPFADAQILEDIALVFPVNVMRNPIELEKAQIKRIKRDPETDRLEVGLEFSQISNREQKRLTDLVYELQRQYLRHRLPLDI